MSLLSNDANYDMDKALEEVANKKLLLDVKVETQTILQLMVAKGMVTREEVAETRARVKGSSNYKPLYDYLEEAEKTTTYYKQNPQQYLQEIFKMKIDGKL